MSQLLALASTNLFALVPTLIVLIGGVLVCALRVGDRGERVAAPLGVGFLALALGAVLRLAVTTLAWPVETLDPFGALLRGPASPFPAILTVTRPDHLTWLTSLLVALSALGMLLSVSGPPRSIVAGLLIATSAALFCLVSPAPSALAVGWLALALAPLLGRSSEVADRSDGRRWFVLAATLAAVFFFAGVVLTNPSGGALTVEASPSGLRAVLVILAASTAGVGPLGGVVRGMGRTLIERFVATAAFPAVGYLLAERLSTDGFGGSALARLLLVLLALWSVGGALFRRSTRWRRIAEILVALAFLALATASTTLALLGFLFLGAGTVLGLTGEGVLAGSDERVALFSAPWLNPREWLDDLTIPDGFAGVTGELAALVRVVEERYDLAVGLLLALAAVSAFTR